jgi:hypothetical protein
MLAVFIIILPLVELDSVHGGNSMIGGDRQGGTGHHYSARNQRTRHKVGAPTLP